MNLDVVTSSYKVTGYLTGSENEKRKEWRNGAERLQTLLFSGATWLELANHRCENRIPQSVSLVNP